MHTVHRIYASHTQYICATCIPTAHRTYTSHIHPIPTAQYNYTMYPHTTLARHTHPLQPTAAPVDPRTLPSIQPKSKVKLVRDSDEQIKKKKKKSKERNKENENYGTDSDSDSDFDFMGDDDSVLAALRAKRLGQLRAQGSKTLEFKAKGHGEYNTIVQDEFLPKVTASKYVVCHFFHRDFERCKIVDKHLRSLAP